MQVAIRVGLHMSHCFICSNVSLLFVPYCFHLCEEFRESAASSEGLVMVSNPGCRIAVTDYLFDSISSRTNMEYLVNALDEENADEDEESR